MSYRSIYQSDGAAVKAAVQRLRQRIPSADAMDETLSRLEAGLRQSKQAVRRAGITPAQEAARVQRFQQGRTVAGDRRIPAPPTLKNPPYDTGEAENQAQGAIDVLGLRDQEHGRAPWDVAALGAIPAYRRVRQHMADFEDYLHPRTPRFSPLGDTSVELAQARWNQGRRPSGRLVVDQADVWNAALAAERER